MLYSKIEAKPEAKIHSLSNWLVIKNPNIKGVAINPNPIIKPIKSKIFENNDQKTLDDMNKVFKTIKKYYKLEMSREDLEYYERKKDLFSFMKFVTFIESFGRRYAVTYRIPRDLMAVEPAFKDYEDYYAAAIKRDGILVNQKRTLTM